MTTNEPNDALRRAAEFLTEQGNAYLDRPSADAAATADGGPPRDRRRFRVVAGGVVVAGVLAGSALGAAAITGSLPIPILGLDNRTADPTDAVEAGAAGNGTDDGTSERASGESGSDADPAASDATATSTTTAPIRLDRLSSNAGRQDGSDDPESITPDVDDIAIGLGPVISDVVAPGSVNAGTALTISWTVSDPDGLPLGRYLSSPASWMVVGSPYGYVPWCAFPVDATLVSGTGTEARYTASCDIPRNVPNGTYTVFIGALDTDGNRSEWGGGAEVTIVGGSSDTTPPRATLLSISPAAITPGGDLRPGVDIVVRWRMSDESGIESVTPWVLGPNGFIFDLASGQPWGPVLLPGTLVSGTPSDGIYESVLAVSPDAPEGTYQLWFSAADTVGNRTYEAFAGADGRPATFQLRLNGPR